jgi:hypothetical protein
MTETASSAETNRLILVVLLFPFPGEWRSESSKAGREW